MSKIQNNITSLQNLLEQVNALPEAVEQATPSISVDASGLITATAGAKSSAYQLAFQAAKTITPTIANQIAVSSGYYTGGDITVAGDSNLVAENIKSGVSIFGVNGTFGGQGNQSGNEDVIINRTVSGEYINDRLEFVGAYAFYSCTSLTAVSFPNCTSISNSAFAYCRNLTTALFPNCINIGSYAFYNCTSLTAVSFPSCISIDTGAFYNCQGLATVSFPSCTIIGSNAFQLCASLTTVSFPNCTTIGYSAFASCGKLITASFPKCTSISACAFYSCTSLATASFPSCTIIGDSAFASCKNLTTVSFPNCTNINRYAFCSCSSLTTVSLPSCTIIGSSAFSRCFLLKSLYLTGSSVCKLSNSQAFSYTPIGGYSTSAGTYGSIYVPTSLLTSYQNATNWTYFSSRFVGI